MFGSSLLSPSSSLLLFSLLSGVGISSYRFPVEQELSPPLAEKYKKITVLNKIYSRNPEIGEEPIFILLGGGKSPNKSSILNSEAAFVWSAAFVTFPRCNSGVSTKWRIVGDFYKFELASQF